MGQICKRNRGMVEEIEKREIRMKAIAKGREVPFYKGFSGNAIYM